MSIISYRTSMPFMMFFLDASTILIVGSILTIDLSTSPNANIVNSNDVICLIVVLLNFLNDISEILSTNPYPLDSKYGKISSKNISKVSV